MEQVEPGEGADQRHGHGDHRDQRRAPALQECEHDQDYEHGGDQQGLDDLVDRFLHETRRVERDEIADTLRKGFHQLVHRRTRAGGDVERIGARLQEHGDADRGLAVERRERVVAQCTELDPGDVLEAQRAAGAARAQDDVAELLRLDHPPACRDRVHQRLIIRRRLLADLAGGVLVVLDPDRVGDVGGGDAERRHLVGPQPDAHRVVAGAEDGGVGDAGNALEVVEDVDRGVVRQEQRVVARIVRAQRDDEQDVRRALLRDDAVAADVVGKARQRKGDAVVDVDHRLVDVGADLEGGGDRQRAVGRRAGAEVERDSRPRTAVPRSARQRSARASPHWRRGSSR